MMSLYYSIPEATMQAILPKSKLKCLNSYLEGLPIERDRVEKHGSESGELIKVEGTVVVGVVASKFPEHDR